MLQCFLNNSRTLVPRDLRFSPFGRAKGGGGDGNLYKSWSVKQGTCVSLYNKLIKTCNFYFITGNPSLSNRTPSTFYLVEFTWCRATVYCISDVCESAVFRREISRIGTFYCSFQPIWKTQITGTFMNWLVDFYIDSRPRLAFSNGENRRSLTASVLELFKKHWSTLYFYMIIYFI